MTAGQEEGTRHRIARESAAGGGVPRHRHRARPTAGSQDALRDLDAGRVDVALVQGGLEMDDLPGLRQVATLHVEPLHLLVKEEIHRAVAPTSPDCAARWSTSASSAAGRAVLAAEVLEFSGLRPEVDFTASRLGYAELEREADRSRLPDAVFSVSTLPSSGPGTS